MTKSINSREIVVGILSEVFEKNRFSHIVINEALKKVQDLNKQERSFINKLAEGTIEKTIELDFIINKFSKIKVEKMKPLIRNILRMSVYQMKYMDSVPSSAVCNEAVKITGKKGFVNLKSFVNGVLRNIAREIDAIEYPDDLSIKYSMPKWIIQTWEKDYGHEVTIKILEGLNIQRDTSVRCNLSRENKQEIIKSLNEQNISVRETEFADEVLFIKGYDNIKDIEAHKKGLIQVQDLSSVLSISNAGIKKDDKIIDVCAAPGGKSLHAADLLAGTGSVLSRDVSEYKVNLINENIKRSRFNNIKAEIKDALIYYPDSEGVADVLIADLPCSGLGIIAKKTDIKYKITPEGIKELVALQRNILKTVYRYVKPGGVLIYSTCTVTAAENQENVTWFKENFPFEEISVKQILPGEIESDGFFMAKFRRKL